MTLLQMHHPHPRHLRSLSLTQLAGRHFDLSVHVATGIAGLSGHIKASSELNCDMSTGTIRHPLLFSIPIPSAVRRHGNEREYVRRVTYGVTSLFQHSCLMVTVDWEADTPEIRVISAFPVDLAGSPLMPSLAA